MSKVEITDFGEKIGGARKDLYRRRGLTIKDLDDLNIREYLDTVTKDYIWPKPNYMSFKGKMPDVNIYYMKLVRDKIKQNITLYNDGRDRDRAENFIKFINHVREVMVNNITEEDIDNIINNIIEPYKDADSGKITVYNTDVPGFDNAFLRAISMLITSKRSIKTECYIQGFPETFRGDLRGIRVIEISNGWRILKGNSYISTERFKSEEDAIEYSRTTLKEVLDGKKKTKKVSDIVKVVRPQLESIERYGPDIRNNNNTTGDHLLEVFGFRGGEFGNWNTQDDRQACLNYVFDSLVDLAYILGAPVGMMSLGTDEDR